MHRLSSEPAYQVKTHVARSKENVSCHPRQNSRLIFPNLHEAYYSCVSLVASLYVYTCMRIPYVVSRMQAGCCTLQACCIALRAIWTWHSSGRLQCTAATQLACTQCLQKHLQQVRAPVPPPATRAQGVQTHKI